ncbi:MAG TPA: hypothetical protein VGL63_09640 [Streptosporangiaceae bacterium]
MSLLSAVFLLGGVGSGAHAAATRTARSVPATRTLPAAAPTGPVSSTPASNTPELYKTGTTEQVRQLVACGGIMYAVGSFTEIKQGRLHYIRDNAFSFSATSPYTVTSWDPDVNGIVNSIAFDGSDCSNAYLGGQFSSIGGTSVKDIAEVSTSTGAVNPAFGHSTNGQVNTLVVAGGHLLTGGSFTSVNGSSQNYYVSLDPVTGRDDGYLQLALTGSYQYPGAFTNHTNIYNQQLSHNGRRLLVEGVFTMVGGQPRQQIFMLDLGSASATLSDWTSAEFNQFCADKHPFYVKAAAWAPGDSAVYTATTGEFAFGWNQTYPLTGLCDSVAAFPSAEQSVSHEWINYDGCDSLYSVAADASTVYAGGHQRWADNANGCNDAGPGSVAAPGMGGFSPATGALTFNLTRSRGLGADDMLLTTKGLWIASDNFEASDKCAGVADHAGICFLPYS